MIMQKIIFTVSASLKEYVIIASNVVGHLLLLRQKNFEFWKEEEFHFSVIR